MRAEECSFVKALEQSRPVLATQPGAALGVPFTTRMQVSAWHPTWEGSYDMRVWTHAQPVNVDMFISKCCRDQGA